MAAALVTLSRDEPITAMAALSNLVARGRWSAELRSGLVTGLRSPDSAVRAATWASSSVTCARASLAAASAWRRASASSLLALARLRWMSPPE